MKAKMGEPTMKNRRDFILSAAAGASYALLERRFLRLKDQPPSLRSLLGVLRR